MPQRSKKALLSVGNISLNPAKKIVKIDGKVTPFSRGDTNALELLMRNAEIAVGYRAMDDATRSRAHLGVDSTSGSNVYVGGRVSGRVTNLVRQLEERGARAKQKIAAREFQESICRGGDRLHDPSVKRNCAIEPKGTSTTDRPAIHRLYCSTDRLRRNNRVGVNEDELVASSDFCAGVSRGGDLAMPKRRDDGAVLFCNRGGSIRGGVVGNDDLEWFI